MFIRLSFVLLALVGCYQSYELTGDAGMPVDAPADAALDVETPADAEAGCIPIRVAPAIGYGAFVSPHFGGLWLTDSDGIRSVERLDSNESSESLLIEGCVPREGAPWSVTLGISGTIFSPSLYGVDSELQTEIYTYDDHGLPAVRERDERQFRVRPKSAGNRFLVQHGLLDPVYVDEDYRGFCEDRHGPCPMHFVEVDGAGALVGGGGAALMREREYEIASGEDELVEVVTEVRFEAGGAAPPFDTVIVQAFDCSGVQFWTRPTQVDRWRCGIASTPVELAVAWDASEGVATGALPLVAVAEGLVADTIVARAASGDWEALAMEPLSRGVREVRFEVPAIESVDVSGATLGALRWRVEASRYERGFAALGAREPEAGIFRENSLHLPIEAGPIFEVPRVSAGYLRHRDPERETFEVRALYVGAITVRDGEPWRDHTVKVAVARAVVPFTPDYPSPIAP